MGAVTSFLNVLLVLTAEGCSTNAVPVVPNAREGNPIVLARMLEIGALRQGIYESIPSFWSKIQKYGNQLSYTLAQKKTYFLSEVRPDIRDKIYRIDQTKPINDIINSLAKLKLSFPMTDMQKIIQDAFAKQQAESKAKMEKLKDEFQAQQLQVATVGNFQPPSKFYPIKSEKPQQAFYIVNQE
ncbi:20739_t:CDS:2, partial [Cetraspora pellucida]